MMLSGIIGLSACGNKTEQPQQNADTLEVADTIKEDTAAIDTPQTAEVQENAQEEKTVEKNRLKEKEAFKICQEKIRKH